MKKHAIIYLLAAMVALLSSCETDIDYPTEYGQNLQLELNSVVQSGARIKLFVSLATSNAMAQYPMVEKYSSFWEYVYDWGAVVYDWDRKEHIARNLTHSAHVTLEVNGGTPIEMTPTEFVDSSARVSMWYYTCDYRPQPGDKLTFKASCKGGLLGEDPTKTFEVTASTMVEPVPEIKVNSIERVYHKWNLNITDLGEIDKLIADSAMRVSITIHDIDPSVTNYYNVYADCRLWDDMFYLFSSDDILFSDPHLTSSFGNTPAGFSPMFDDHLFDGKDYTFTILVPEFHSPRSAKEPLFHLQVDALSQPLYYFWKAYERYRIAFDDPMANPVRIPSNVEGGWGNVGAVSSTRTLTYGFWRVGHQ